jgi:hypothetical protein
MNSDANRLCCLVNGLEVAESDDARLYAVVGLVLTIVRCLEVHVCDWNLIFGFDVLVLRLCMPICSELLCPPSLLLAQELFAISDTRRVIDRDMFAVCRFVYRK